MTMSQEEDDREYAEIVREIAMDAERQARDFEQSIGEEESDMSLTERALVQVARQLGVLVQIHAIDLITDLDSDDDDDDDDDDDE
jgi:hypothetical protein